ncbi:MAG: GAF domain-containing sensor histidine kinase [candidate division NC10 bacterium]|nr:GAF domain-containing sensor histidine kinase [candidate division NC10 bacterium]
MSQAMGGVKPPESGGADEWRERVRQLTVLLEAVRSLHGEMDPERLPGLLTEEARRLAGAQGAVLYLLDRKAGRLTAQLGENPEAPRVSMSLEEGIAGLTARTGRAHIVSDAPADSRFSPALDRATGVPTASLVSVPVTNRRGEVLAVLQARNRTGGPFSVGDAEVLSALALQAASALENAQLYGQVRVHVERLSRLLEVGKAINAEMDLDALLALIVERATRLLQADRSSLFLVDREKKELWTKVAEGLATTEIRIPLGTGIAGTVAVSGETVNIADAYADARFNPEVDRKTGYRTRTILCLPMRDKAGDILGVFQVLNKREGVFGKEDEEVLSAVASQAAIALENARLYDDLKQAYDRIKQLDQAKSDFLANISHELRTPLTPVIGYMDMMASEALGPITEHQRKGLEVMQQSVDRMRHLVEDLLSFVRMEQRQLTLQAGPFEVGTFVAEVVASQRPKAQGKGLPLTVQVPDEPLLVKGDRGELVRVLAHLIDNAIKFTNKGEVTVSAAPVTTEGGRPAVEITVRDTGMGIPPGEEERIFQRFYQVDASSTRRYGGTGLGLAIVKEIVEAHGSRIVVETAPGKGSRFSFRLTLLRPAA